MPDASRRAVLAAGGIAAAASTLAVAAPGTAATATATVPRRGVFTAVRGRMVVLTAGRVRVRALVAEVEDNMGARRGDPRRYSLFLKPVKPVPDGLYRIGGAGLARTTLFFANVDVRASARLQAVVDAAPPRARRPVRSPVSK